MTIIETSSNQLFSVRDAGAGLEHVWLGVPVRRHQKLVAIGGKTKLVFDYKPTAKAREVLVRKESSRIVREG